MKGWWVELGFKSFGVVSVITSEKDAVLEGRGGGYSKKVDRYGSESIGER